MCKFGCLSQVTTSVLAIVRMISIFCPFLHVPQRMSLSYIALYSLLMTVNNFGFAFCQFLELTPSVRYVITLTLDYCYWLNIIQCMLGILASLFTAVKIFSKRGAEADSRTRSCWIIIIMNLPYCLSAINFILSKTHLARYGYVYLTFVIVPCFTSMLNPLVVVLLNHKIREFTWSLLQGRSGVRGTVATDLESNSYRVTSKTIKRKEENQTGC